MARHAVIRASAVTLELARVGVPADMVVTNNGVTSWRWVRPDVLDMQLRNGLLYRLTACPTGTESDLPGVQRLVAFTRDDLSRSPGAVRALRMDAW